MVRLDYKNDLNNSLLTSTVKIIKKGQENGQEKSIRQNTWLTRRRCCW